jgi:hypothetical protein
MTISKLDIEYLQWELTQNMVSHIVSNWCDNKSRMYEFHNAIERMLMSMCNSPLYNERISEPWTIYYTIAKTDPFINQITREILHKCGVDHYIDNIIDYIIYTINSFVSMEYPKYLSTAPIRIYKKRLTYRQFTITLPASEITKLKRYPSKPMMAMVMRYSAIIIKSQQWAVPSKLVNILYNKYNVRFEAFASPLNNGFGCKKNAEYCSLFLSDKKFGSIGSIFDINMANPINHVRLKSVGWLIHPPYIEDIMLKAYKHMMNGFETAVLQGITLFCVFVIPYNPDSNIYKLIRRSHYPFSEIVMNRHTHYYENHGRYINSSFDTVMFIFDQSDNKEISQYSDIINAMFINNMPKPMNNLSKNIKALMHLDDRSQITITDKDDSTNVITLSANTNTPWRIKYRKALDNYVVNTKDVSALVVKI